MAENNKDLKQLKIKTSSLTRIQKEYFGYKQEEQKQQERIGKLKAQNADDADIKKQVQNFSKQKKEEVLEETFQMYPNIIGRLIDAVNDLQNWLDGKKNDPLIQTSNEKQIAVDAIINANEFLQAHNPAQ